VISSLEAIRSRAERVRAATAANASAVRRARRYLRGLQAPSPAATPGVRPPNDLRTYYDAVATGPGVWKWLHYFEMYERHLARFRGREVHILEVGIFSGGSIEMWRTYLGDGCHFYGVDIEDACRVYEKPGVEIFIGDQADPAFWSGVRAAVPRLDVLIDDGGHLPVQQMATLEAMLPHIRPGGVYVCEDVQGETNAFHTYIDVLTRPLSNFIGLGPVAPSPLQEHVASVHRYPQAVVIEKPALPVEPFDAPKRGTEWQPYFV
jgi:hypothetical protein